MAFDDLDTVRLVGNVRLDDADHVAVELRAPLRIALDFHELQAAAIGFMLIRFLPMRTSRSGYAIYPLVSHNSRPYIEGVGR